jgi:aminopeptidase-like protein
VIFDKFENLFRKRFVIKDQFPGDGKIMLEFISRVWNFNRSITGPGTSQTLQEINRELPKLQVRKIKSGTVCWDWEIPKVWRVNNAYILDSEGNEIVNLINNNLHLTSYSIPFDGYIGLEELKKHINTLSENPDAIPYATSYYHSSWSFNLAYSEFKNLKDELYYVKIESSFEEGFLEYGELYIEGESKKEIVFTTYVCHPSMANNELSGPAVAIELAKYIQSLHRYYSYRILFVPETIGTIAFLSQNLDGLKANFLSGHVLTCLGDERAWSYMPSRKGQELCDFVSRRVLIDNQIEYREFSFLERGSDERQYCSPLVNLPVSSIMRSKYGTFPEYHNSKDNLDFISAKGLNDSLRIHTLLVDEYERNRVPRAVKYGEPMLSKRNLRSTLGGGNLSSEERLISNVLAFSDGSVDIEELSRILKVSKEKLWSAVDLLIKEGLVSYL